MKAHKPKIAKKTKLKPKHRDTGIGTRCKCGLDSVVPELLPWYLFLIIVSVRIYYVLQPRNWWLLHPDEIFQSIEVAHSEVYGNGFRTYEYSPPIVNVTTPVEEQEHKQGMYSLRSFIYPYFFASVLYVCRWIGITTNSYLIGRITQSVVTSLTPLAVYRFCFTTFTCRGIACIASILTACSLHLSVLGTHTLVNSFVSPFLFLALEYILRHVTVQSSTCDVLEQNLTQDRNFDSDDKSSFPKYNPNDGLCDVNSNHEIYLCNKHNNNNVDRKSNSGITSDAKTEIFKTGKSKRTKKKTTDTTDYVDVFKLVLCGYISAILCYMRPDTLLFLAEIGMAFLIVYREFVSLDKFRYLTMTVGLGFSIGILTGGCLDWYTYGIFFISPIQWTRLNAASHIPAVLYGSHSPYQYLFDIFATSSSELYFHIACVAGFIYMMTQTTYIEQKNQKSSSSLLLTLFLTLLMYSIVAHKEIRFVHNVLIIIIILAAYSIHGTLKCFNDNIPLSMRKVATIVILLGTFTALNTYVNFPSYQKRIMLPWNTVTPSDSADINQCLDFIGHRNDATGLFLDASVYMTAAYSILQRNIPLICLVHYEYHEYRSGIYKFWNDLNYHAPGHLYVINRYLDLIDISNSHYLSKRLLESQEYNYILLPTHKVKFFNRHGYNKVHFSTGGYSVVQRSVSESERTRLMSAGKSMPIGNNVTILEYEASWLYTAGLYDKVIKRLESAMKLNVTRIRPYQLLSASYANKYDLENAKLIEDKCIVKFGKTQCRTPQTKVILHDDYSQFNIS